MHEVGLMQNALALALDSAAQAQAHRIEQLVIQVGVLAGVEPEALRFAFEVLRQGTIAEQAELRIETQPLVCFCQRCQQPFEPLTLGYECPDCHTWSCSILQGKELQLVQLEVS